MIDNDDDIKWVKAQRPSVTPPDAEATGWARAALMLHADRSTRLTCIESPRRSDARAGHRSDAPAGRRSDAPAGRRRMAGFFRGRRGVATAAAVALVAAAGIAAAFAVFPSGGNKGIDRVLGVDQAYAKPLLQLATHVAAVPLTGEGALVLHTNNVQGERSFTGADLYLDDGRYYYAETAAGLPAAVKAGPLDYSLKAAIDAMASVSSADPQVARAAFLKAIDPQWGGDLERDVTWRQDNAIWVNGIDVLGAAYGRPDVLAGLLRALATVDGVTVTPGTRDGVKTLEISMAVPEQTRNMKLAIASKLKGITDARLRKRISAQISSGPKVIPAYVMQATVDADSGALLRYTDTGLVVTYQVSRVDAADYGL